MNTVRRHLSRIKGGQLAIATTVPVPFATLALSDVVGDVPEDIGPDRRSRTRQRSGTRSRSSVGTVWEPVYLNE